MIKEFKEFVKDLEWKRILFGTALTWIAGFNLLSFSIWIGVFFLLFTQLIFLFAFIVFWKRGKK